MNFLNLGAFIFALSIPIVALLYFLKLKRKEKIISSTMLWNQLIRDTRANAPFQRLKRNILLILQILFLAFLVSSLARPFFPAKVRQGKNIILILDASASMQSTDLSQSRFELAKKEALRMITDMREGDKMMVISASARTDVKSSFTGKKDELARVVKSLKAKDTLTNLMDAICLSLSLVKGGEENDIYILSDGAFKKVEDLDTEKANIQFISIGKGGENVGITALDVRKNIASQFDYEVFLSIKNFSENPKELGLELKTEGRLADFRKLALSPGEEKNQIFESFGLQSGLIEASLKLDDDLTVDNTAWTILQRKPQVSVLLVSRGNPFLERAINLDPRTMVSKMSPADFPPSKNYDLTIIDGFSPEKMPSGNCMLINCSSSLIETQGEVEQPVIIDWDHSHPLMRFVDFSEVRLGTCLKFEEPKWATCLVETDKTPLIIAGENEERRIVFIGFDTVKSNWPLRVAFPIFFSNAINWLAPQGEGSSARQWKTGDVVKIYLNSEETEFQVIDPKGNVNGVAISQIGAPLVFKDTEYAGVYRVKGKDLEERFCVNLVSPAESDIKPSSEITIGRKEVVAATGARMMNKEIWRWFALFAFAILIFEWWIFHRRAFI